MEKYIRKNDRQKLLNQRGTVIWLTGLSGSGKSTLSGELEKELYSRGFKTFVLDGDALREGLCKDLGFSQKDRTENIRRVGEVAKLMMDSGLIVISALISPFDKDREEVRKLIGNDNFILVFVDCPIHICEQRDVKGLYRKAREGEIKTFTGINSPFEAPQKADLILRTNEFSKEYLIKELLDFVRPKIELNR